MARSRRCSVAGSRREEASSKMTRPGFRRKTRVNASNCASPADNERLPVSNSVSKPSGRERYQSPNSNSSRVARFLIRNRAIKEITTNRGPYVVAVIVLMLSHGLSTALYWFARGERDVVSPQRAMTQPYGRVVILHVVVLASFFLLVAGTVGGLGGSRAPGAGSLDVRLWPAILLVTVKVVVDVVTHLRQHRPVPRLPRLPRLPRRARVE